MFFLPAEILAMSGQLQRTKRRDADARADAEDRSERFWLRNNLSAEALGKFQATVHGIHRRFDEVMARRAVVLADRSIE
ncbi:MAG: hypothetical protein ACN6O2_01285 [Stenotrophomonas sp.]